MEYVTRNVKDILAFAEANGVTVEINEPYIHLSKDEKQTWFGVDRHGRFNGCRSNFDKDLYIFGYRRELNQEELLGYIKGQYTGPWFSVWLDEQFESFGKDYDKFKRYINKTFNVRNKIILLDDGTVELKINIVTIHFWSCGEITTKIYNKESYNRDFIASYAYHYLDNGELVWFKSEDNPMYDIGDASYYLSQLIDMDFEECEEHPGTWYKADGVCPICAQKFKIHSYSQDALQFFKFRKLDAEKNPVYYGVELEFDTDPTKVSIALKKHTHHMIAKHDGSIAGFELVTAPATFPVHKEEFSTFPFDKQTVTSRDGMHVHIDKKALTTMQIGKICEFIYNKENLRVLTKVAGRSPTQYCSTTDGVKTLLGSLEEYENGLNYRVEGSHGTAVNVSNKNTIEVRIFRTPETYEEFMTRLEFVKAMVDYTKPGAVNQGFKEFKELNRFLNYVTECRKVYPNLFQSII